MTLETQKKKLKRTKCVFGVRQPGTFRFYCATRCGYGRENRLSARTRDAAARGRRCVVVRPKKIKITRIVADNDDDDVTRRRQAARIRADCSRSRAAAAACWSYPNRTLYIVMFAPRGRRSSKLFFFLRRKIFPPPRPYVRGLK